MTVRQLRLIAPLAAALVVIGLVFSVSLLRPAADGGPRGFATTAAPLSKGSAPAAAVAPEVQTSYAASTAPDLSSVTAVVDGTAFKSTIWPNFQRYVAGCMLRKGFSYSASASPLYTSAAPPPSKLDSSVTAAEPAISAVAPAMVDMAPAAAPSSLASTNNSYLNALRGPSTATSSTDYRAYDGVNTVNAQAKVEVAGGCELEGRKAVTYPAMEAASRVNVDLQPLLDSIFLTAKAQSVNTAWSACMKAKGYDYASYVDPPALFQVRADVLSDGAATATAWSKLRSQESATNLASAACASTSGVTTFITQKVQPAWSTFRSSHLADLNQAGGMTNARGDL